MHAQAVELHPSDYVIYLIGEVAQLHVGLEVNLRQIWRGLAWGGLTASAGIDVGLDKITPPPKRWGGLHKEVEKRLSAMELPEDAQRAASVVLQRLRDVTIERNRVVHDHWVNLGESQNGVFHGFNKDDPEDQLTGARGDIPMALDCRFELIRCGTDVHKLSLLLQHFAPIYGGVSSLPTVSELVRRIAER